MREWPYRQGWHPHLRFSLYRPPSGLVLWQVRVLPILIYGTGWAWKYTITEEGIYTLSDLKVIYSARFCFRSALCRDMSCNASCSAANVTTHNSGNMLPTGMIGDTLYWNDTITIVATVVIRWRWRKGGGGKERKGRGETKGYTPARIGWQEPWESNSCRAYEIGGGWARTKSSTFSKRLTCSQKGRKIKESTRSTWPSLSSWRDTFCWLPDHSPQYNMAWGWDKRNSLSLDSLLFCFACQSNTEKSTSGALSSSCAPIEGTILLKADRYLPNPFLPVAHSSYWRRSHPPPH